eukprot:3977879-Pyramimonas_sp.AAC.1
MNEGVGRKNMNLVMRRRRGRRMKKRSIMVATSSLGVGGLGGVRFQAPPFFPFGEGFTSPLSPLSWT